MDKKPLVEGRIANFGISLDVFAFWMGGSWVFLVHPETTLPDKGGGKALIHKMWIKVVFCFVSTPPLGKPSRELPPNRVGGFGLNAPQMPLNNFASIFLNPFRFYDNIRTLFCIQSFFF